jgi:hypothetical protein
MKKFFAFLIVSAALVACGGKTETSETAVDTTTVVETPVVADTTATDTTGVAVDTTAVQ